jgi:hypothetical protein
MMRPFTGRNVPDDPSDGRRGEPEGNVLRLDLALVGRGPDKHICLVTPC